jgi:phosphohistidine swiveling domain-containing protein
MDPVRQATAEDLARIAEIEVFSYRLLFYPIFRDDGFYFGELQVPRLMEDYRRSVGTFLVYDDGVVKGFIRVEKGEILVTSNTDPGWTVVFSKLGGLITETGGILCHGAVISREYRIPAVTAVKSATTILKTGDMVSVNGSKGEVTILEEKE